MVSMPVDEVISLARAETLPAEVPSEYLRLCCPLCFGGDHCHDESFLCVPMFLYMCIVSSCHDLQNGLYCVLGCMFHSEEKAFS